MLWTVVLTYPLMVAIQAICAPDRLRHRRGSRRQHGARRWQAPRRSQPKQGLW